MAWLHTWLGLLLGWVLYFMFVTGTAGYLDTEIDRWMRPELPVAQYPLPAGGTAAAAISHLQSVAPDARRWGIQLPIDRNEPYLHVTWQASGASAPASAWLDPHTGASLQARDTGGGQWLYQMHWRLHYLPELAAEWIVSVATLVLWLALLTGIVAHRRILADFFTFRPRKGQRSWLDGHNLASVASLPFQLMISYSGLVFLMFSLVPMIATAWYGPGTQAVRTFYGELFPPMAAAKPSGERAPLVSIEQIIRDARQRWQGEPVAVIDIQHPGDANARISVFGNFAEGPVRSTNTLVYDGVSGALLAQRPARQSAPRASRDLMLGLHEGLFAAPVLRALYVLSGLLGCVMIATGLVLWTVKRRERAVRGRHAAQAGLRLVERLNVAVVMGLPVAIAAYFWANRLLPLEMAQRAQMEVHAMFLVWLLLFVHAAWTPARKAWKVQAWLAAAGCAGLPLLNAATTDRHLAHSLLAGDGVMAGFDLGMLALGTCIAAAAWRWGNKP